MQCDIIWRATSQTRERRNTMRKPRHIKEAELKKRKKKALRKKGILHEVSKKKESTKP